MSLRLGLQARFALIAAVALLAVVAVVAVLLQRQAAMQREIVRIGQESMHRLASDRLRVRGEATVTQLAESLVNPLYYFDLDAMGVAMRSVLRQPDVDYVVVYDGSGSVIHDGSADISTYGQAMRDAMAYEVVSADRLHVQSDARVLDVSAPIRIGGQRLGGVRVGYSLASEIGRAHV